MGQNAISRVALCLAGLLLALTSNGAAQIATNVDLSTLQQQADDHYAEGDLESATRLYLEIGRQATAANARAQALVTAGWLQHLQQRDLAALDTLTRALDIDPELPFDASHYNRDFEVLYQRALDEVARMRQRQSSQKVREALVAMEAGQDREARQGLQEALDLTPASAVATYNLALLDLRQGDDDAAMTGFERAVALSFKHSTPSAASLRAKAQTSIGVIFFKRGAWQDAEESFLEATRASPEEALAWKNLGLVRLEKGEYPSAVQALRTAIDLDPDDPQLAQELARALSESARGPEAVDLLSRSLERHPSEAALWSRLGEVQLQLGSLEQAALAFQRAVETDPGNADGTAAAASTRLAFIRYQQGSYDIAASRASEAVQWDPDDAEAWHLLGLSQQAGGDPESAAASLERATALEPNRAELFLALGDIHMATGNLQPAETAFTTALSLDPGSEVAKQNLESARSRLATERAIVVGAQAAPRSRNKPIPPKKIGLRFVELNYKKLNLRGALVDKVNKKSPAARAGLRKGDLLLWLGDYGLLSDKDFFDYLKRSPPGESLDLEYLRDGKIYAVELKLR